MITVIWKILYLLNILLHVAAAPANSVNVLIVIGWC